MIDTGQHAARQTVISAPDPGIHERHRARVRAMIDAEPTYEGYRAHNGHIFTQAEADAYNRACTDTAHAEREAHRAPQVEQRSELARHALEHARDQQHRLFKTIIGD